MADGRIQCLAVDTPTPSCFAHEILNANPFAFLDDAPLEERRARAVEMRRLLPDTVLQSMGRLDPEMIAQVQEQAWPDVRNADELHDTLQTLIAWPEQENFRSFFTELCAGKRAGHSLINGKIFWWAAEKFSEFSLIYFQNDKQGQCDDYGSALVNMIRGWLFHSGPIWSNAG